MAVIDQVKQLLGLTGTERDELLTAIVSVTEARLAVLLGGASTTVPDKLSYITVEVAIRRFNRIGSEGLQSHTVEGEQMTWPDDDFKPYYNDITAYKASQKADGYAGRVIIL